jgi:hypothetical protein
MREHQYNIIKEITKHRVFHFAVAVVYGVVACGGIDKATLAIILSGLYGAMAVISK